ncbi:85/88 kDa calcium-independent phospholipase A2-like [Ornithodoros turicata]|uniref:85/88 kDa calcium-independent phospholipase A2-like n=1 Tax=Ornithodoros turicata TaxID=34597 RepID=UPI003139560A
MTMPLLQLLRGQRNPASDEVLKVKPDDYALFNILVREDALILYRCSMGDTAEAASAPYEIVLHNDITRSSKCAYSVLRTRDYIEAQHSFILLKDQLPLLVECVPDVYKTERIQEVVNLIRANPSWNLAHVAAHLALIDCFNNPRVLPLIGEATPETRVTPLHVAVCAQKLAAVQALMATDVPLDLMDQNGDTVYHQAAVTNKDIINALSARPAPAAAINQVNNEGHTPLQLACRANKPECVLELLKQGADLNSASDSFDGNNRPFLQKDHVKHMCDFEVDDMKYGGTPLHWAKTTQCLEAMIELGCGLDAKNFQGNTALHIMVARSRLSCVVGLLSHGASVDAVGKDGDTPLHAAVRGDVSVVQALIVFGADVNCTNEKNETPRHLASSLSVGNRDEVIHALHAVGARRCSRNHGCTNGCAADGTCNGKCPEKPKFFSAPHLYDDLLGKDVVESALRRLREDLQRKKRSGRVLCLDGGGIRGLILTRVLMCLETVLGCAIMDCFDWVAGTSTGGILALMLALGKTPQKCLQRYFALKDRVFIGIRPYDTDALEEFLRREMGENTVMTDIERPKLIVTALMADRHPAKLHLFRNYTSPKRMLGLEEDNSEIPAPAPPHPCEQPVWAAARASGAAPTYFRPFGRFLDGGLIANNPTLDTMREITAYNKALKATGQEDRVEPMQVVVSVGTGTVQPVEVSLTSMLHTENSLWGTAQMVFGLPGLIELMTDQATQANGCPVERAQAWCSAMNVPYFRINAPMSEDIDLDEKDDERLVRVLWETMVYMRTRRAELDELAELIRPR